MPLLRGILSSFYSTLILKRTCLLPFLHKAKVKEEWCAKWMKNSSLIYFDHNATSPLDLRVEKKFFQLCQEFWANPSSLHYEGQKAQQELLESRERLAQCLGVERDELYYTSGGTESNNLFLQGVQLPPKRNKVLASTIEHPAVLNVFKAWEAQGRSVGYISVEGQGRVSLSHLKSLLTEDVGLVAVMFANNETGVIQPIAEIARLCREREILCFTDAVQAVGKIPIDAKKLGVHGLSFSGHKFYAPKGVGGLYIEKGIHCSPLQRGGHQEREVRPGTENVPAFSAMSWALQYLTKEYSEIEIQMKSLKQRLLSAFLQMKGVHLNGDVENSLSNTLNIAVEGVNAESLVVNLDLRHIAVSTGSACSSGATEPSHVLSAMGLSREKCKSSIRLSLGKENTLAEVEQFLAVFPSCIQRLKNIAL